MWGLAAIVAGLLEGASSKSLELAMGGEKPPEPEVYESEIGVSPVATASKAEIAQKMNEAMEKVRAQNEAKLQQLRAIARASTTTHPYGGMGGSGFLQSATTSSTGSLSALIAHGSTTTTATTYIPSTMGYPTAGTSATAPWYGGTAWPAGTYKVMQDGANHRYIAYDQYGNILGSYDYASGVMSHVAPVIAEETREVFVSTDAGYVQLPAFKAGAYVSYKSSDGGVYYIWEDGNLVCEVSAKTGATIHYENGLKVAVPSSLVAEPPKPLTPGQMEKIYKATNTKIEKLEEKLHVTKEPTSSELLIAMKERVEALEERLDKLYAAIDAIEATPYKEAAE